MGTRAERSEVVVSIVSSLTTSMDGLDERNLYRNPATIHQIPIDVRKGNESAYTPKVVPIGPYNLNVHRGSYLHEQTEGMKISFLNDFLDRTGRDKMNEYASLIESREEEERDFLLNDFRDRTRRDKMNEYASLIESREEEARDCYHDRCNGLESEEFVQMMVLDGCFIIEFLLKFSTDPYNHPFFMFNTSKYLRDLHDDLMLMENQIPFFILKLIFDNSGLDIREVQGGVPRRIEILDLCLRYLHYVHLRQGKITKEMLEPSHQEGGKNVYHLLHLSYLCHMVEIIPEMESPPETLQDRLIEKTKRVFYFIAYVFLFPIKCFLVLFSYFRWYFFDALILLLRFIKLANKIMWQKPNMYNRQRVGAEEEKKPWMIPTATELNEFGVTFKRKKDAKNSMDVSFENGIMEIPEVLIYDGSNTIFRNYLALEQNCQEVGNTFSSYAVFMDNLVDTTSDVALLKKSKIIVTMLGSDEEIAMFFNQLTVGLLFGSDSHYLYMLFQDVCVHCKNNRNKWRGKMIKWRTMLMRDYFSSPWKIISLLGAVTLLAFTATQVTYAVKNSRRK